MKLLVGVDLQNDFITGSLGTPEAQAIVPKVVEKLRQADDADTVVLFTQDTHGENYLETLEGKLLPVKHCIKGTDGWELEEQIAAAADACLKHTIAGLPANKRIEKHTFGSERLRIFLREQNAAIEEIEFIGLCTDICVISNALMARMELPNTRIVVDASCCAGVTPEKHRAALEVMQSCQIEVTNN